MKSHAAVVAEPGERAVRFATLRADPPMSLRPTNGALHLVGSAAGPVGGDDAAFEVAVEAGADLVIRTVAAQTLYPGRSPSHARYEVTVRAGASLSWLPEPTIAVRGADHRVTVDIDLAADASLVWRDVIVLGRHAESSGSVAQRLRVVRDGRVLVCTENRLGPAWAHAEGPAGTAGYRVVATELVVGNSVRARPPGVSRGVECSLADDAWLFIGVA